MKEIKIIKPNLAFTLYFTVMFCLYTNTYIQLISQLSIIGYVIIPIFKSTIVKKQRINNLIFCLWWIGAFTLFMYISKYWAYSTLVNSNRMLTSFRIFVIVLSIFLYADSKEKAISLVKSFIIACLIMGIIAMLTTPLSKYGKAGDGFGAKIGQHRNQIGAVSAPMVFICYYLKKNYSLKYANFFIVFFVILTLITGSRSSILQIVLIYSFNIFINGNNLLKKFKNFIIYILLAILTLIIIRSIPFLYEVVWVRIDNAIMTTLKNESMDNSTLGRAYYKEIAYKMFKEKPILGYGIDGFKCFLRDNPYIMGQYLETVVAHCNYAEIAADFGIIGLLIWYVPIILIIFKMYKIRKRDEWTAGIFSVFLSMIIFDYSRIPWSTHLSIYMFSIIILLCRYQILESEKNKKIKKYFTI